MDAHNGSLLWEFDPGLGEMLGTPAIDGRHLYVANIGGRLMALNQEDGVLEATYNLGQRIGQKGPAVANGVMYVVTKDRYLHAVRMIASQ
jgi:outer membrane protein assembly factor BamB